MSLIPARPQDLDENIVGIAFINYNSRPYIPDVTLQVINTETPRPNPTP